MDSVARGQFANLLVVTKVLYVIIIFQGIKMVNLLVRIIMG